MLWSRKSTPVHDPSRVAGLDLTASRLRAAAVGGGKVRTLALDPDRLRHHAETFSRQRFLAEFRSAVDDAWMHREQGALPQDVRGRRSQPLRENEP